MSHLVLLGDSSFDNATYVPGGPDVMRQVRERLPLGWQATLNAVDGDVINDVAIQLGQIPPDATHLVVSVGGNDTLGQAGILGESARSVADALARLADARASFELDYHQMLQTLLSHKLPTAVSTIYYPRFPDAQLQTIAVTALTLFNDCILRLAFMYALPVLDLRLICNEASDYANEIEPSVAGGAKIAGVIAKVVTEHDFHSGRSTIYT